MAKNEIILTNQAPAPVGPYSQAVVAGPFVFCSGQISIDPSSNQVLMGEVSSQARQVMENIKNLLAAAKASLGDVVKTTIFLTDMADFAAVNEEYAKHFTGSFPARSTVAVLGLPKGVKVEIEVVAYRG